MFSVFSDIKQKIFAWNHLIYDKKWLSQSINELFQLYSSCVIQTGIIDGCSLCSSKLVDTFFFFLGKSSVAKKKSHSVAISLLGTVWLKLSQVQQIFCTQLCKIILHRLLMYKGHFCFQTSLNWHEQILKLLSLSECCCFFTVEQQAVSYGTDAGFNVKSTLPKDQFCDCLACGSSWPEVMQSQTPLVAYQAVPRADHW